MAQPSEVTRKPETSHLSSEQQEALPPAARIALSQVDNLKYFLLSAPVDWNQDQYIRRFLLPTGEYVSCVLWANLFHITGTDIVRCLAFRFHAFGRPVKNSKKFEEGIFSDLRNLKAGNDASLEEPKSPFLDFLYKNNCIRTQKKQKVFYWYSVPHDRLFLDALERDLKREKSGQEATTESKSEPSISFQYDATRSLYEQLNHTEEQDQPESNAVDMTQSRSVSVAPDTSSYGQHQYQQQQANTVSSTNDYVSSSALNDNLTSSQAMQVAPMPPIMENQMMMPTSIEMTKNNDAYDMSFDSGHSTDVQLSYDHHGIPYEQSQPMPPMQRHNSVPNFYMEPSPAPSFASTQSYYDGQSRAVSYEPVTPPQYGYHNVQSQYAHNDNAYYGNGYDQQNMYQNTQQYSSAMPPPPPPRFSSVPRQFPSAAQYTHIEGSPMYKQRRRGSSLTGGYSAPYPQVAAQMPSSMQMPSNYATPYAARRPSDLRRSMSASVVPQAHMQERASSNPPPGSHAYMSRLRQSQTPDRSCQSSPLASVEQPMHQPMQLMRDRYAGLLQDGSHAASHSRQSSPGACAVRRARSATVADTDPYPTKAHSCPIPGCGRTFKRLEHLKRHVRTHTQEKPYECPHCDKAFSRSDNLAQHRRTHEPNGSSTDDEPESDSCAGLTEDVDSPESVKTNNAVLPPLDSFDSFTSYASYSEKDAGFNADDFYGQGSMDPGQVPVSIAHGYGY